MDGRRATESPADEAVFAATRLVNRRRPSMAAAGAGLVVGALVVVGLIGGPPGDRVIDPLGTASGPQAAAAPSATSPLLDLGRTRPPRQTGPAPSLDPRLVRLELNPAGRDLFVHGDVFAIDVIVVVVSLEDAQGRLDTQSVRLATGSTAFRLGANARFDVRFDVPEGSRRESLWVRANAYDTHGDTAESVRYPVWTTATGR